AVGDLKITGQQIVLDGKLSNPEAAVKTAKLNFEGAMVDGKVRGSLTFSDGGGMMPAQLIPTESDTLDDYQDSYPVEGTIEFDNALRTPDPARGVWKIVKTRPDSPLSLDGYGFLFSNIHQWNLSEQEIQEAAADFSTAVEQWGSRLESFSKINAGMHLA